jgi:Tol biopolymer transport system component
VVNADGTGLTEIPRDNPIFREDDAGWSPDGTQIVFSALAQDYQEPGIYRIDAAGGLAAKISEDPPGCDAAGEPGEPSWHDGFVGGRLEWSPDGAQILFTRNYNEFAGGKCVAGSGWPDLLVMNADGSDVSFIVQDPDQYVLKPSWSPDGSKIVYEVDGTEIHVINPDGTGDVAIISGGSVAANSPDWGP